MRTGERFEPSWLAHRQPGSKLPTNTEQARRILRAGNLRDDLLKHGPQLALRVGKIEMSRDELRARVEAVAGGLSTMGTGRGTMVSLYAPNSLDWTTAFLGAIYLGRDRQCDQPCIQEGGAPPHPRRRLTRSCHHRFSRE